MTGETVVVLGTGVLSTGATVAEVLGAEVLVVGTGRGAGAGTGTAEGTGRDVVGCAVSTGRGSSVTPTFCRPGLMGAPVVVSGAAVVVGTAEVVAGTALVLGANVLVTGAAEAVVGAAVVSRAAGAGAGAAHVRKVGGISTAAVQKGSGQA